MGGSTSVPDRMSPRSRAAGFAEARTDTDGALLLYFLEGGVSKASRGAKRDREACGSPIALVTLLACERVDGAPGPPALVETVERREASGVVYFPTLLEIKRN